ncbi:MAG: outer membrane protein assembly factor BamE [Nitrosomonadales bacterium]|nr:outer membrane protein assembly factor BamE [Nitrosomonadales bacterium]
MRIALIVFSILLAACSTPLLAPHKVEVLQGNLITPEMRANIKEGMTRLQVRVVLGTPLINDPFHADRWDYVYSLTQEGKLVTQQRLTLFFDGDSLKRIDDSHMPPPVSAEKK